MIEIIDERSVRTDLLTPGGYVLDVGARGYVFAREMARRGCNVIAVDPEPPLGREFPNHVAALEILNEAFDRQIKYVVGGLVGIGKTGKHTFASWDNGEPDCVVGFGGPVPPRASMREVECYDIAQIMDRYGVREWDCVKMNCEGAEYSILSTWPGPIARQTTVSFHDHTGANPRGEETYRELLAHLGQWYVPVRHVAEERYGAGMSYWDSLFVRKDLA